MDIIDFSKMLEISKKKQNLENKQIKKLSFYNYLNDTKDNLIIDCRLNTEENYKLEGGSLRSSFILNNFSPNNTDIKIGSRLLLILEDFQDIKTSPELEKLRSFIKNDDKIDNGIFVIKNLDYQLFLKEYNCFVVNENTDKLQQMVAQTHFPIMVLDKLLYVGNFMNSKNLHQLKILKIKSVFSFLKELDTDLKDIIPNFNFVEVDEENHEEIDFMDILEMMEYERTEENTPILLYCFSGQTISIAVCIAYLMRYKTWSLEFSTAYIMKICPNFNIPTWLYFQLQKIDIKKEFKKKEKIIFI